jgi:crotonobetainyl-CoA:carnitine CoA-transferase CaiB-like acyl-CoA transferase
VPAAPVLHGGTVTELDHVKARELFDTNPRGGFPHPRPPFRSVQKPERPLEPAPSLGQHDGVRLPAKPARSRPDAAPAGAVRPLEGVRVLDITAFWAGPAATQYLASLGADVIKLESIQRPDAIRFNSTVPPTADQWWEQGFLFLSANLDKRGITLNLADPRGRELALALVAQSNVVVENFSPRVMENFGLTYDEIRAARPDVITVRMPGWGLEGPWRERPGFATTMEQAGGMAWVTGYDGGSPMSPGLCDPLAGIHASFAMLAALEEQRATGRGQDIEISMIDMAVNVAAEQVIEQHVYGHLMTRCGNHSPRSAPQGAYTCAGENEWVAVSISTDEEWSRLREALGAPAWAADPALESFAGRRSAVDRLDDELAAWAAARPLADALRVLRRAGVPAEPVVHSYAVDEDEQMRARGFWEPITHPLVGEVPYPGWPMKLSGDQGPWHRSPSPLLGQHTEEVLGKELGLGADEIASLREAGVIGDRPLGL